MVTITLDEQGKIANVDFVEWALTEIADKAFKRTQVADTYAILLRKGATNERWAQINTAIIARWSPAALRWIKEEAWKRAARFPGKPTSSEV